MAKNKTRSVKAVNNPEETAKRYHFLRGKNAASTKCEEEKDIIRQEKEKITTDLQNETIKVTRLQTAADIQEKENQKKIEQKESNKKLFWVSLGTYLLVIVLLLLFSEKNQGVCILLTIVGVLVACFASLFISKFLKDKDIKIIEFGFPLFTIILVGSVFLANGSITLGQVADLFLGAANNALKEKN